MSWYHYLACFFAGFCLANTVPHFVHGISGKSFRTPFARLQGKGLSSPTVNVVWGLVNLLVGFILLRVGLVSPANDWGLLALFAGVTFVSISLSKAFADRPQ